MRCALGQVLLAFLWSDGLTVWHEAENIQGETFLLLHSVLTSTYLWRNVVPHLRSQGRVVAMDMIGGYDEYYILLSHVMLVRENVIFYLYSYSKIYDLEFLH